VLTSPAGSQKLRGSKRCGHAALAAAWALGALGQALSLKFTKATLATMCGNQLAKSRELRSSPSLVTGGHEGCAHGMWHTRHAPCMSKCRCSGCECCLLMVLGNQSCSSSLQCCWSQCR
jgi:hypothetical protein